MFGLGVLKGLGITLRHFINTFVDDLKYFPVGSKTSAEAFAKRQGPEGAGLFTVEYPEMKLHIPENFRFIPFLVTDFDVPKDDPAYDWDKAYDQNRCTSCGICAKVCPPQCIWIVRTNDPKTGKPIPQPAEFYIDTDICMNCGYCAEFCPFDAIKMDHDFELADYNRETAHIHDLKRLLQPIGHYATIRPTWYTQEEEARRQAEEEKRRKEEAKKKAAAEKAAKAKAAKEAKAGGEKPAGKRTPEEIKAQREAMLAKRAAKAAGKEAGDEAAPPEKRKRTPEEIKAQREAMMAKRAARAAGKSGDEEKAESAEEAKPPEKRKRTPEEIKAQREAMMAKRAARAAGKSGDEEKPAAEPAAPAPEKADDLTKIEGIGPKISKLLQESGIKTFAQLAATEVGRLEELLQAANLRLADPGTWPEQAQLAASGDWDALDKLQDELKGGKRA